ncbi:hypothetical protein VNO77_42028 [Canavalia gladiata]|uniref:Uncharacterized protein n=1 Tax=Canavalia gladiata TaxID=3824 RepID=A0AAN9K0V6_CANGL
MDACMRGQQGLTSSEGFWGRGFMLHKDQFHSGYKKDRDSTPMARGQTQFHYKREADTNLIIASQRREEFCRFKDKSEYSINYLQKLGGWFPKDSWPNFDWILSHNLASFP